MGYRDSDDSSFSRHGMGRDHDEGRYSEQRAHRGSLERDEPRGGGYGAEFDDRGPYPQYGMARNDYRADGEFNTRADRSRPARPMDRFQYGGGYRNDGREMDLSYPQRFGSGHRDEYPDQERGNYGYARRGYGRGGGAGYGSDDASMRGTADYSRSRQPHPQGQQGHHDPDYQQWREEQMRMLDDDYQSWRQERYQKFSDDFNSWRSSRTSQASSGKGPTGNTTGPGSSASAASGNTTSSSAQSGSASNKSKDAS